MVLLQQPVTCVYTNVQPSSIITITRKLKQPKYLAQKVFKFTISLWVVSIRMISCYKVRTKGRKYYKYLFWANLFDLAITNSVILVRNFTNIKPNNVKDLRTQLGKDLISNYCSRKRAGRPSLTSKSKN